MVYIKRLDVAVLSKECLSVQDLSCGVSGGALAAVFGMYERLISFLAHITKNFKENVWFFLPVWD